MRGIAKYSLELSANCSNRHTIIVVCRRFCLVFLVYSVLFKKNALFHWLGRGTVFELNSGKPCTTVLTLSISPF